MASLSGFFERNSLYVALLAAWVAMLGSLYFSEVNGYVPCQLCWYQRILMYPLTAVIGVGILRRDIQLPFLILPLSVFGIFLSTYHYLIQKTQLFSSMSVCKEGVPCSTIYINWLGFITIPFLALTAFVIITVMTLIAMNTNESVLDRTGPLPWLPVGGLVGGTIVVFALLAIIGSQRIVETSRPAPAFSPSGVSGEMMTEGGSLYQQACAACHGMQMEGVAGLGNVLTTSQFVAENNDQKLLAFVRAGRGLNDPLNTSGLVMPASGGRPDLSDAQMLSIIAQIRMAQTKTTP